MKIINLKQKSIKDLLFNVMLSFVIMLVVLDAVPSTNSLEFRSKSHSKIKNHLKTVKKNDYYYKSKYEEFPDEPIFIEKSSKKTKDGMILPVLKVPAYKTVISNSNNENSNSKLPYFENTKLSDSTDNISEGVKLASTDNYSNDKNAQYKIASGVDDVYAESTNANEIAKDPLFDNSVKKYQEYRSAGIFSNGLVKEQEYKFDIKKKLNEEIDSEEDETTKKSNKVLNNLINGQKQSLKLNSTDDLKKYLVDVDHNKNFDSSNKKNNIYFADNDIDYAVDKKIRETNENQPDAFVSHNLVHKEEKNDDINSIETKSKHLDEDKKSQQNTNELRLRNKLDHLLENLKRKIYDNPKDYDFYFKDTVYEFKHFLVSERIIEPTSYHVDDPSISEKNNDAEKLKKLDNIEKQILKENDDKKKNDRINDRLKNDKNDINNIEDVLNNRLNKEKLAIMNLKSKKTIVFEKITEKHKDEHKNISVSKNKIVKSGNNEEEEDSLISKIRNEIFESENGKKYNNNLFSDEHYKNEHKTIEKENKKPAIKIEKLKAKLLNENSISAQNSHLIESKLIKDHVKNSTDDHIKSDLNNHSFVQKNVTKNSSTKKSNLKKSEEVEGESVLSELLKSMK